MVEEAALFEFLRLLATNQLKVFASLGMFLEEYRIGNDQSSLLLCAQALVSRLDLIPPRSYRDRDEDDYPLTGSPYYGHGGWMR